MKANRTNNIKIYLKLKWWEWLMFWKWKQYRQKYKLINYFYQTNHKKIEKQIKQKIRDYLLYGKEYESK